MRGWYSVALCAVSAWLLWGKGHPYWFCLAVANGLGNLWSFGIMHNFRYNPELAPDSWSWVNLITTLVGVGLLIYGIILNIETYP